MFVSQLVLKSFALLVFLVSSASVVVAQQQDDKNANATLATLMTNDDNKTDSSSLLMTNYNALREEGQGFFLREVSSLYEKPDSVTTSFVALDWWGDLEFSSDDATNNYGYVGRAVGYILGSSLGVYDEQIYSLPKF